MSDSLAEQVNIMIAGGELPDAFTGVGFSNYDLMTYGEDGTFIDLTPYINEETMPNLTKILEEHPEIRAAITMDNGAIYGLLAGEQMGTAGIGKESDYSIYSIPQFSMINKAWLDDLGLEVPTTLDELHDALVAFKENDMSAKYYGNAAGSTIPMSTGIPLILLSMGKSGSRAYAGGLCVEVPSILQENTIETTGAGDTFCACVLHYVLEHGLEGDSKEGLEEMLRFANAAASIITTRKGALRVMPEKEEIEELLAGISK